MKRHKREDIRQRLKAGQDRQKSYFDVRCKDLEFKVWEHVYLKVSPTKGVVCFGSSGKLKLIYFGPFQILNRVESLAY